MKNIHYRAAAGKLRKLGDPARAATSQGYFKDSAGDVFLGVTTPALRKLGWEFREMPLVDIRRLMKSIVHEERSLANEILRIRYENGSAAQQEEIFNFYLKNLSLIRGWDSVDGSAPYIMGCHLLKRDKKLLYELAKSPRIWDRRIAVVSTLWFIRRGNIAPTLKIAPMLLGDKEDLIHKATGWMLREVGKQNLQALLEFLDRHGTGMPRTTLRYAIERFPEDQRLKYLKRSK